MPRNKQGRFVKKTTAQKIRERADKGLSTKEIAKDLGIRYQMVRNTLARTKAEVEATPAEA